MFGSGGGESAVFAKPAYQSLVSTQTRNRAVPDIAMHMGSLDNGESEDVAAFGGQLIAVVGTSASAPEFAGLLAVAAQAHGGMRFGNVNPLIYELAHSPSAGSYFHQSIAVSNGVIEIGSYPSTYNVVIGNGTPIANQLLLLPNVPLAGDPQTPSNP